MYVINDVDIVNYWYYWCIMNDIMYKYDYITLLCMIILKISCIIDQL